jgi:putative membrane protein
MIEYNRKRWIRVILSYRGTVLPRIVSRLVLLASFTLAIDLYHRHVYQFQGLDPLGHTLIGAALGLLIVLRTNSAYDRYWEGRKLWGGVVNAARNLVRSAASHLGEAEELARRVTAFTLALRLHLGGRKDLSALAGLVPPSVLARAAASPNTPVVLAGFISSWVTEKQKAGLIDAPLARYLDARVGELVECQGHCERIMRTPIPFVYAAQIKQLLMIYLITLPFVLVPKMDWAAPLAVIFIMFGLLGVEVAGVEIEAPFGDDPNCLPLDELAAVVGRDAAELARAVREAPDEAAPPAKNDGSQPGTDHVAQ